MAFSLLFLLLAWFFLGHPLWKAGGFISSSPDRTNVLPFSVGEVRLDEKHLVLIPTEIWPTFEAIKLS